MFILIPTAYFSFKYKIIRVHINYMLENMKLCADFPQHFSTGVPWKKLVLKMNNILAVATASLFLPDFFRLLAQQAAGLGVNRAADCFTGALSLPDREEGTQGC